MVNKIKPGENAPQRGEYKEVRRTGTPTGRVVDMQKRGDTMPPTQKSTQGYKKK